MRFNSKRRSWGAITGRPTTIAGANFTDLVGGDLRAYKTADESVSSTTLQDDDHLTIAVAASTKYHFRFYLFVSAAGAVEGLKLAVGGTCTVTSMKGNVTILDDVNSAIAKVGLVTALNSSIGIALPIGTTRAVVEGSAEVNGAGTLLLSWAQFAGIGLASTTVQRGSFLVVEKLG